MIKNKIPPNFYNVNFVIIQLSHDLLNKIKDYENLIRDKRFDEDFYNIKYVYMHSILLDIAKLLGATKNDKASLFRTLKNISSIKIKGEISKLELKYQDMITKVIHNRNRIIAHVDVSNVGSYFNMGFSEIEINRKIEDYKNSYYYDGVNSEKLINNLKKMKSSGPDNERYSPSDFYGDLSLFKDMINEILVINDDINKYYYNKQNAI